MTSSCDSGATVAAGVYSIYLTAKECCESHFYWDIDACLASPSTPPPTTRPSVVEQQTPIDIVGPQQMKPPPDGDTVGILLAPIYIRFSNMQSQLQLDEEDREQLQDIIRRSLLVASDEFNITITSVDAVDSIFSNKDDQTISMSMYLKITITGEDVDPREVQIAFTNALQDQVYLIDNEIQNSWGTASNNMVTGIGNAETGGDVVSTRISIESSSSVPVWGIILIILLFAFLCGGLLVLQRRRLDKGDSLPRHTNESYFEKSQPCEEGRYNNNPRDRQHMSKSNQQHRSFNESQQTLTRKDGGDEIIVPRNKPDPDGEKSFNKSMSFTQSALNINQGLESIEQGFKQHSESNQRKWSSEGGMQRESSQEHDIQIHRSVDHEQRARGKEELNEEEDGYDGGQSSFFITTNDNYEVQEESSDDSSEENNSSDDDVGVLGLMYYDGASSAGESLGAKESRLSRRSKRSKKSTKSRTSSRVSQSQQQPPPIARKKEVTKHKEQHQNVTVDGQKDYPYVLPPYNKRKSDHSDCPNIYVGGEASVVSGLSSTEEFNHHDARSKFNKSSTILEELD